MPVKKKTLTAVVKCIIVTDIAEGVTQETVARKLGSHVKTVQCYLKNPAPIGSHGLPKVFRRRYRQGSGKEPGKTSIRIFEDSGLRKKLCEIGS